MRRFLPRIVFGIFAVLFVIAAALQYNDEQALRWFAIYGFAAASCAAGAADRTPPWPLLLAFAGVCIAYTVVLSIAVASGDVTPMFETASSKPPTFFETKEGREIGGLVLVVVATVGLLSYDRGEQSPAP